MKMNKSCRLARCLLRFEVEFFAVVKSFLPTQSVERTLMFLSLFTESNPKQCWYFQALKAAWSCTLQCSMLSLVDLHTSVTTDIAPLIRDSHDKLSHTKSRFSNAVTLAGK